MFSTLYNFKWLLPSLDVAAHADTEDAKEAALWEREKVELFQAQHIALKEQREQHRDKRTKKMEDMHTAVKLTLDAKGLDDLRNTQLFGISEMDAQRRRDVRSQVIKLKTEKLKSPSADKLKDRMDFLLRFLAAERRNLDPKKEAFENEFEENVSLQKTILKLEADSTTSVAAARARCELQLKRNALREKAMEVTETVDAINEAIDQIKECLRLGADKGTDDVDLVELDIGAILRIVVSGPLPAKKSDTTDEKRDDTIAIAEDISGVLSVSKWGFGRCVSAAEMEAAVLNEAGVLEEARALKVKHLVIFIHGFSETTDEVYARTEVLHRSFKTDKVVTVAWNWNTHKLISHFHYDLDRDTAVTIAPRFLDFMKTLHDAKYFSQIDIVTHSMGGLILVKAMKAAKEDERIDVFGGCHIACVAADVRTSKYVKWLTEMRDTVSQWTHYYNDADKALWASYVYNWSERAGNHPIPIVLGTTKVQSIKVVPIRLSPDFESICGHHYIDNGGFKEDLHKALIENMPPAASERGLTELGGSRHWRLDARTRESDRTYGCKFDC